MGKVLEWLKGKLVEKSTWAGVAMIASAAGWNLSSGMISSVCALIAATVSLYEVIRNER